MGIGLDARGLRVHVCNSSEEPSTLPNSRAPAVLIPMLRGEPLQVEDPKMPRSRGTGFDYPLEAKYSPQTETGCGRFPLTEIWSRLGAPKKDQNSKHWKWLHQRHEVPSIKALNTFIGHTLRNLKKSSASSDTTPGPAVVVVPNHITIEQRSQLLRSLRDRTTKLLWRPIAAAMAWSRENQDLLDDPDQPQLYIYCLHLGLEGFTIDQVPFREYDGSSETALIPVRERNLLPHCPEIGLASCRDSLKELGIESDEEVWKTLYSSAAPHRLFEIDAFKNSLSEYWVRQFSDPSTTLVQWLEQVKRQIEQKIHNQNPGLPHAVICTGEFSMDLPGNTSLPQLILEKLGIETGKIILESNSGWLRPESLAISAHTYSRNLAKDRVSYLDELPDLQLLITKRGVAEWRSLREEELVPGGKPATLIKVKDFSLTLGERHLNFFVHHEDYETVRKAELSFTQAYDQDIQLELDVSLEPAGGNAVIEARPLKQTSEVHFNKVVDWDRAEDTEKTPEEIRKEQPLAFPPHAPRTTSLEDWCPEEPTRYFISPMDRLERLLNRPGTDYQALHDLVDAAFLRGNKTAPFDSDGNPPSDLTPDDIEKISKVQHLLFRLYKNAQVPFDTKERIFRCLAYMSWNEHAFLDHLEEGLSAFRSSATYMTAYGQCLRTKNHIQMFSEVCIRHLRTRANLSGGENDCIKALWRILRYRSDACDFLTDETCFKLIGSTGLGTEFHNAGESDESRTPHVYDEVLSGASGHGLLHVLNKEYEKKLRRNKRMGWIANYSCCGILWLLRRRMYKSNFLPPNCLQAIMAKKLAKKILSDLKNRKIKAVKAKYSNTHLLEEFIKYIDQQGGQLPAELYDS